MVVLPVSDDILGEAQRIMMALEVRRSELPFADDMLTLCRSTHEELQVSHVSSKEAIAAWRDALARRWDCEVAGRRLYKQILSQLIEFCGSTEVPEIQLLSRGEAEVDSSPSELLADLRRLQAALQVGVKALSFATERLSEVEEACFALAAAISDADSCEVRRRAAVLDSRMAHEAYLRVRNEMRRTIVAHFGNRAMLEFGEIFG